MARDYDYRDFLHAPYNPTAYRPNYGEAFDSVLGYLDKKGQQGKENEFKARELDRTDRRDANTDERDRVTQEQHAREMLMNDKRAGQREELYGKQEDRHQEDAMFNRKKLLQQEHEALIQELYQAINTPGQDAATRQNRIMAAQDALHRAGYGTHVNENTPSGPTLPPAVPQADPAPVQRPAAPMTKTDKATNSELDKADAAYSKGLSVSPGLLPGRSPVPRVTSPEVAQSDAMLSPDDPYNQIVK